MLWFWEFSYCSMLCYIITTKPTNNSRVWSLNVKTIIICWAAAWGVLWNTSILWEKHKYKYRNTNRGREETWQYAILHRKWPGGTRPWSVPTKQSKMVHPAPHWLPGDGPVPHLVNKIFLSNPFIWKYV